MNEDYPTRPDIPAVTSGLPGPQGERGPQGESKLIGTASAIVDRLVIADNKRKWQVRVITAVCVLLGALSVVVGLGYLHVRDLTSQLKQETVTTHAIVLREQAGAIASCQSGNRARATNRLTWDTFLTLALDNPATAATRARLFGMIAVSGIPEPEAHLAYQIIGVQYTTSPEARMVVHKFEAYIAQNEKAQNCARLYKLP